MPDFVRTEGTGFTLNGKRYPIVGANCYYLGYCPLDSPAMVESVLDSADAFPLNVLRIWAFQDLPRAAGGPPSGMFGACFQYFDEQQGRIVQVDGDAGLRRLDRAIALAAARGYRLILVLTNGPPDLGGMDQYLRWMPNPGTYHDEFYDREDVATAYEQWAQRLVERTNAETGRQYKDEPAILAWELANEPRCSMAGGLPARGDCARSGRILRWAARMSAFIKSIDSNHLIATGDEGFFNRRLSCHRLYNGSYGVDCEALLRLPDIDFGTYHLYPQAWDADRGFGLRWIEQHSTAARRAQKPMLLEEFGLRVGDGFVRTESDRDALYTEWLQASAAGGSGSLFWMLAGVEPDGQRFRGADRYCLFGADEAPAIVAHAREILPPREAILA
jgi:mannan endo-1,4-beta-mannosidase